MQLDPRLVGRSKDRRRLYEAHVNSLERIRKMDSEIKGLRSVLRYEKQDKKKWIDLTRDLAGAVTDWKRACEEKDLQVSRLKKRARVSKSKMG